MKKGIVLTVKTVLVSLSLFFASCSQPTEVEKITFLEKRIFTGEDSVVDLYLREKGDAHGGAFFSRTDSARTYGIGTMYFINDTTLNKDLRVKINMWVRSNVAAPGASYAVALHEGDKVIGWYEIKMDKHVTEPNKWINVTDSVTIPGTLISKPGLIVKAFSFNTTKNVVLDGDDLELSFSNVKKEFVE